MPPEIVDHRIAGLDRMKRATCRRSFEQSAKLHKTVAGAARIESVESDRVTFFALECSPVGQSHRPDSALMTNSSSVDFKPEQVSRLPARINFFHQCFDLLRRELRCDEIIFKRNEIPYVVHGFRAGSEIAFLIENTVHCAVHS